MAKVIDNIVGDMLRSMDISISKIKALQAENQQLKNLLERSGLCPACLLGAPEPFGCSDCLNTGWAQGAPSGFVRDVPEKSGKIVAYIDPDHIANLANGPPHGAIVVGRPHGSFTQPLYDRPYGVIPK